MWADNETSEDLLGFKVHADLLIDVISDETILPVTIGVFGDWGSGKSSILKIIAEELSGEEDELKDDTLVLYFNGWIFEGYDDAKAALLESIIKHFREHKTLGQRVQDVTSNLLKSVDWMRALSFGFKKIALPAATAYATGGLSLVPYVKRPYEIFHALMDANIEDSPNFYIKAMNTLSLKDIPAVIGVTFKTYKNNNAINEFIESSIKNSDSPFAVSVKRN
jgi:hypothetical protein